jgi:hypothetical protein
MKDLSLEAALASSSSRMEISLLTPHKPGASFCETNKDLDIPPP